MPHVSGYNDLSWFVGGVLFGWLSVVLFDVAAAIHARRKARRK